MTKDSQCGFAQMLVLVLLTLGIFVGGYLVTQRTNILPHAQEGSKRQSPSPYIPLTTETVAQTPYNGPHNIPGRIEAEDFDNGGEGVAYHDTDATITLPAPPKNQLPLPPPVFIRTNELVDTFSFAPIEITGWDNDFNSPAVGGIAYGEWLEYTVNVTQSGYYSAVVRYLPNRYHHEEPLLFVTFDGIRNSGAYFQLGKRLDTSSGKKIETFNHLNRTFPVQRWNTLTNNSPNPLYLTSGQHIMRFEFSISGIAINGEPFDDADLRGDPNTVTYLNFIEFTPAPAPSP